MPFWRCEVDRADRAAQKYHPAWDTNVQWYQGESPDAATALAARTEWVNVNVDFYEVEQKQAQLFYETPELQLTGTGFLKGQPIPVQAHRNLLNEILGDDHMDVMTPIQRVIKDCLCVSGTGPVLLGFDPYQKEADPPAQLGAMLGLKGPIKVTLHAKWYADHFSPKKLLWPADFHDTDWDKAPWLGMRFRMPLPKARQQFTLPPEFTGTTARDEKVLDTAGKSDESSEQHYVEGTLIFYRASHFDEQPVHPELYRELVLIDGLDEPARHRDCPHQTVLPNGSLSGDSLIGNPIHPLTIRTVPDSAVVPSDAQMTRPLVRELCKFRTQQMQLRDANRSRTLYDVDALPPEVVAKIEDGSVGAMIGVESGKLAAGVNAIMAEVTKANPGRQDYTANDYIEKDIAKTLALGANQTSVGEDQSKSATEVSVMDRASNVRLDAERRQVLRWYLKLVDKVSALVLKYMTPQMAAQYIGPEQAQAWAQLQQLVKNGTDGRLVFKARPDSQIRLDAAAERKFALDLYQFCRKDPLAPGGQLLRNLFEKAGLDGSMIPDQMPEKKPDPTLAFAFKGEDLGAPWADQVREILAQAGIELSPEAVRQGASQMFKQIALGVRDASGKAVTAQKSPAEHGGTAEKVRPLSQQSADQSGQRSGPKANVA